MVLPRLCRQWIYILQIPFNETQDSICFFIVLSASFLFADQRVNILSKWSLLM